MRFAEVEAPEAPRQSRSPFPSGRSAARSAPVGLGGPRVPGASRSPSTQKVPQTGARERSGTLLGRPMLRVTTLYAASAAATAAYYAHYLTMDPGEEPGVWCGLQADGLGLHGRVATADLEMLLSGRDPLSETRLGSALVDRMGKDGKVIRAVSGYDATFSAPKSLSVWWALTGDPRLLEAHDAAVKAALGHLEQYGSTTRRRRNGRMSFPDTGGLTMATFRQTTSRARRPAAAHPRRRVDQGANRRRSLVRPRRPLHQAAPTHARRLYQSVFGPSCPPVRGRLAPRGEGAG